MIKMANVKSFYIKNGNNRYSDVYLIMYEDCTRQFDMYKLNTNGLSLIPKIESYKSLEIPMECIGEDFKINKDMIINVIDNELNN